MIHTIFNLERPLIIFDCETTGLDIVKDRIIELAFQVFTAEGMTKEWSTYIDPGIPIMNSDTHGITDAIVQSCRVCRKTREEHPTVYRDGNGLEGICKDFHRWPKFADLAKNISQGFSGCDFGGKNVRFDLGILFFEMQREKVEWSYSNARIIDGERIEQLGEPRTLSHLYEKYTGKKHEGAHGALADTRASTVVIVEQMKKFQALPRGLDLLHELQWPGWIDTTGKFRFNREGVPTVKFGKYNGWDMRTVPKDYWIWINKADFSPEIKQLAVNALSGVFPERKSL